MANFNNNVPLSTPSSDGSNRQAFPMMGSTTNEGGNINIHGGAGRNVPVPSFNSSEFNARSPPKGTPSSYGRFIQKRGRLGSGAGFGGSGVGSLDKSRTSTSLSGRLRSVSDLERSGFVTASEKGRLKDLIISGDDSLKSALEKYEAGDTSELESLISKGHLSSADVDGGFDASELDMLDLGSLGLEGTDFLGMFDSDGTRSRQSSISGSQGAMRRRTFSGQTGNSLTATGSSTGNTIQFSHSNSHSNNNHQVLSTTSSNSGGGGGHQLGGGPSSRKDSAGWDYDFGNVGGSNEPFEMDDLGFGGLDSMVDIMPNNNHPPSDPGNELASVLNINPSISNGPGPGSRRANDNYKSNQNGSMMPPHSNGGGGGGGSNQSNGNAARRNNQSSNSGNNTLVLSSSGTVNFPNSTNSGNRFPTSNCVAELPPLQSLPPGQAPAYEQLINFQRAKSKDAVRCVMCGSAPTEGEHGTVIPQQNKDVCRDCDKALWVHGETRTYFKWCKGCKRFRNIVAFSEKLDASKCNSCRERGRRSYLQRKGIGGVSLNEGIIDDELTMDEHLVTSGVPSGDDIGGGLTFSIPEPPSIINERFDLDC